MSKFTLFHKYDSDEFVLVQLFEVVDKMTDWNDPLHVVEKLQLRFVSVIFLQ